MNPAQVALAQLDAILDEQAAEVPAAACPTRGRVGNPTNEAPASLPEAAAAALKRRREQQSAAGPVPSAYNKELLGTIGLTTAEPEAQQPVQLRC